MQSFLSRALSKAAEASSSERSLPVRQSASHNRVAVTGSVWTSLQTAAAGEWGWGQSPAWEGSHWVAG